MSDQNERPVFMVWKIEFADGIADFFVNRVVNRILPVRSLLIGRGVAEGLDDVLAQHPMADTSSLLDRAVIIALIAADFVGPKHRPELQVRLQIVGELLAQLPLHLAGKIQNVAMNAMNKDHGDMVPIRLRSRIASHRHSPRHDSVWCDASALVSRKIERLRSMQPELAVDGADFRGLD